MQRLRAVCTLRLLSSARLLPMQVVQLMKGGSAPQRAVFRATLWLLNNLPAVLERALGLSNTSAHAAALSASDQAWLISMVRAPGLDNPAGVQCPSLNGTDQGAPVGDGQLVASTPHSAELSGDVLGLTALPPAWSSDCLH